MPKINLNEIYFWKTKKHAKNIQIMQKYLRLLEKIANEWDIFYQNLDATYEDNVKEKQKIKIIIEQFYNDNSLTQEDKNELLVKFINFLTKYSGCAEDLEISENLLGSLESMKIIDQKYFDLFYANTSTNRWMQLFIICW